MCRSTIKIVYNWGNLDEGEKYPTLASDEEINDILANLRPFAADYKNLIKTQRPKMLRFYHRLFNQIDKLEKWNKWKDFKDKLGRDVLFDHPDSLEVLSKRDIGSMDVEELRDALDARELPTDGIKAVLTERLMQHENNRETLFMKPSYYWSELFERFDNEDGRLKLPREAIELINELHEAADHNKSALPNPDPGPFHNILKALGLRSG